MKSKFHEGFYSFAKYYDIAFDFRNVPAECEFLADVYAKYTSRPLTSFIEFGAGPALHSLEMAKTLPNVTAIDLSEEMVNYAAEKAELAGVKVHFESANMINYNSRERNDLAALLMDSTSYLLTNAEVILHLRSVAEVLNPGGLYVLEMSHPKSVFNISKSTVNNWAMEKDDVKVKIQWGAADDVFDPITQQTLVSVRMEYEDEGGNGLIVDRSPQRSFTATEFAGLVTASGVFEIVEYYGSMNAAIPFNNDAKSWRMVPVLRKL